MRLLPSFAAGLLLAMAGNLFAAEAPPDSFEKLGAEYTATTRSLVKQFCLECHSTEKMEGELDLEKFATLAEVRQGAKHWTKVVEMLDHGDMPPKEAKQPTADERRQIRSWVERFLRAEAWASAGDPGPVVLRRLNNAEYTYTLRDVTGLESLNPAREFPVDGAAGEGFTNTGAALVMSPALLTKYLDAAKDVASHAVLLPDGIAFSPATTRQDWTNEKLAAIRAFYDEYSDARGAEKVNLQGIVFDTNGGGRLPLAKYLAVLVAEREALTQGKQTPANLARDRHLSPKYLELLWAKLNAPEPSLLLEGLRARFRAAKPADVPALVAEVEAWQKGLWRFTTVGHIGKKNGPKRWLESVEPIANTGEVRLKIPPTAPGGEVTISLVAGDAGDGNAHDFVVWQQPRLVGPGRADLSLRDVRAITSNLEARQASMLGQAAKYLGAAAAALATAGNFDVADLAKKHSVDAGELSAWLHYLGISPSGAVEITGHFTDKLTKSGGYEFIQGWGKAETPNLEANSSDTTVRIPGIMQPHSVAVHPSPTLNVAVGWRSPASAVLNVEGLVQRAHPECGNGVTWTLELRRADSRRKLASGSATQGTKVEKVGPIERLAVNEGDVISLVVGPRGKDHSCDLTTIDLTLTAQGEGGRTWNLARDVSPNVLAGNPHADSFGNVGVWHFYSEAEQASETLAAVPPGSLLAKWQAAASGEERQRLALEVQKLLTAAAPTAKESPDGALREQLTSLTGPLMSRVLQSDPQGLAIQRPAKEEAAGAPGKSEWGLDPARFGDPASGNAADNANLFVQAPAVVEFRLPVALFAGCEFVTTGALVSGKGNEGSVQLDGLIGKATPPSGVAPSEAKTALVGSIWTDGNRRTSLGRPFLVKEGSAAQKRIAAACDDYRELFPAALCYTKLVPVDEVVTLTLFYREDDHLARLMLSDEQKVQLDRLWSELHFVSQDALASVDALAQLLEYASQDGDPKVFAELKQSIADRAAAFKQLLVNREPKHVAALALLAGQLYRRPLTAAESQEIPALYAKLRQEEISHDDAIRLTLARMLVAPEFLYRVEKPVAGRGQGPVSPWEFASRFSYFLNSSPPDAELRAAAAAGKLDAVDEILAQTRRLLKGEKTRRLAVEFACQWLHIRDFDQLNEKSEQTFPMFAGLREPMYEESIRFFADLFQNDGSVLAILNADYTFLNEPLAKHYGIPGVTGPQWRRVDGVKQYSRGGILAQATTLAKQSGASRTSPILRGNWISEVLLGERLPRPPKNVPQLPDEDNSTAGLTVRQLVEKHSSDEKCAVCHRRIDPLGFSLERFDAIGRLRDKDSGNRPLVTTAKTLDGAEFDGLAGLENYLLTARREAFVRQFCKKLLGYALGRAVQLSDEPLLAEMQASLAAKNYRVSAAVEAIVTSRQFREIRGLETAYNAD